MYMPNLKSVALSIHEIIIAIQFPQSWSRGGRRGSGWYHSKERCWVPMGLPYTFPLSLRVSEIGLLPVLSASAPFFAPPPLVSPKFPQVPMEVGGWCLGYQERRCWANCPCNQFPSFPSYVFLIHHVTVTDRRQTDGRTTCDPKSALCTKVHRAVKMISRGSSRPDVNISHSLLLFTYHRTTLISYSLHFRPRSRLGRFRLIQ